MNTEMMAPFSTQSILLGAPTLRTKFTNSAAAKTELALNPGGLLVYKSVSSIDPLVKDLIEGAGEEYLEKTIDGLHEKLKAGDVSIATDLRRVIEKRIGDCEIGVDEQSLALDVLAGSHSFEAVTGECIRSLLSSELEQLQISAIGALRVLSLEKKVAFTLAIRELAHGSSPNTRRAADAFLCRLHKNEGRVYRDPR